ncbi:MAG: ribonuclease E/G, partial [Clostridiales bacterium]|nr:ribonuclease E/G [Clostridiales bacterium]
MKSIMIDSCGDYIRAALVEDRRLVDLIVDKKTGSSITGNVYLGIVKNILPNQFVFIDIGQAKNGFLNSAEYNRESPLRMGQNILVQARKDPSGDKGASLSRKIDIAGRFVVLSETSAGEVGVSHKIKDAAERERLKLLAQSRVSDKFGVILRTSSENRSADE